jgi:ketosteroid isomerase-like protein
MSQEDVEMVRSIVAGWERGDYSTAEWAHPEVEYVITDGPAPGSWTGLDGMAEGVRSFLSAWEDWRFEWEQYRDLEDGRIIVFTRYSGRGKRSGLDVGQMRTKGAGVFHVRDGKVTKLLVYFDRDHALADLSLSE